MFPLCVMNRFSNFTCSSTFRQWPASLINGDGKNRDASMTQIVGTGRLLSIRRVLFFLCLPGQTPWRCFIFSRLLSQVCFGGVSSPSQNNKFSTSWGMGRRKKITSPPDWESCAGISPFKLAEKRYKRYVGQQTDFTEVFDPWQAATRDASLRPCPPPEQPSAMSPSSQREAVVRVPGHDDVLILPAWLTSTEQLTLAHRCLTSYPEPPNKTNLLPHMGPVTGIWEEGGKALEDLRWATLGYQYDWTARSYPEDQRRPMPAEIQAVAAGALAAAGLGAEMRAEAAIVNFYHPSTTLGGHCDDVEPDQSTPIVSVSLGCSAVFLAGGADKQQAPTAVWLRSGDVMVMSGAGRRCMHGVPRILGPDEAASCPSAPHPTGGGAGGQTQTDSHRLGLQCPDTRELERVAEYLQSHRININIRQVFPRDSGLVGASAAMPGASE